MPNKNNTFDWTRLGRDLRASSEDAHNGDAPNVQLAYQFLLDNPESFIGEPELAVLNEGRSEPLTMADVEIGNVDWPADMPVEAPIELIAAYYRATADTPAVQSPESQQASDHDSQGGQS